MANSISVSETWSSAAALLSLVTKRRGNTTLRSSAEAVPRAVEHAVLARTAGPDDQIPAVPPSHHPHAFAPHAATAGMPSCKPDLHEIGPAVRLDGAAVLEPRRMRRVERDHPHGRWPGSCPAPSRQAGTRRAEGSRAHSRRTAHRDGRSRQLPLPRCCRSATCRAPHWARPSAPQAHCGARPGPPPASSEIRRSTRHRQSPPRHGPRSHHHGWRACTPSRWARSRMARLLSAACLACMAWRSAM